ncbi:hypothetical protein GCM10010302_16470 [Streptomyces polychromogenes]|uniref:Uncharacterized protein n=1 Tax=Streptomyces polychromogenes TaxID=67342 RepID=A0ABN0V7W0_9ACTN
MRRVRWGEVLLSALAAVGCAVAAMAGVAALGLHLLDADVQGGRLGADDRGRGGGGGGAGRAGRASGRVGPLVPALSRGGSR